MPKAMEGLKAASEVAKQIITLSTGVLAVTIAFFDKVQEGTRSESVLFYITTSWCGFAASIIFAVVTLMGVTASLDGLDQIENGEKPWPPLETAAPGVGAAPPLEHYPS